MCILGGHRKWRLWSILYQIKQWFFFLKSSKTYNHLLSYSKIIYSTFFKKITEIKFYDENDNFIVAFSQLLHSYFYTFFSFFYLLITKIIITKKVKEKKTHIQTPKPPFMDFSPLRSSTVRMLCILAAVGAFGIYTPVFFLVCLNVLFHIIFRANINFLLI